ncbi:glycosyl transferase family 2 [Actinomyces naeslundii]|uniref:glycosyltransferase family 2 protein n=1 Tax=Actinomyces naeslundii TaxID=1655 RepID=UPI00096EA7CC|nr:glycosyltransferase family 2 protein [Actinomyces naeslundii]OMG33671.1 glycosyl transferase family 2 [Actinomyces naeslundii]
MTATPEPTLSTDAAETAESAAPENVGGLSGHELLSRTAVVVVSYDSAALLEHTLARVAEDSPEARIVVVDNYSTPAAREELVALASSRGWEAVLPQTNTGFGGGMNLGAARARELGADLLVLLNPDAVIARADLIRLAARAYADRSALVAPVLKDSTGRIVSDGIVVCLADGSMRSRRSPRPIPPGGTQPWLSGACLALSTDLFEAAGGFDARYFLYWEDVDFSARVLAAGGSLDLARGAVAVHDEGGTHSEAQGSHDSQDSEQGDRSKSDIYYYYNVRNRLLYAGLHLDRATQRRWVATAGRAAREIVLRGGRRQLLRTRRPLITAAQATRDGLRLLRAARRGELPDVDEPLIRG